MDMNDGTHTCVTLGECDFYLFDFHILIFVQFYQ